MSIYYDNNCGDSTVATISPDENYFYLSVYNESFSTNYSLYAYAVQSDGKLTLITPDTEVLDSDVRIIITTHIPY